MKVMVVLAGVLAASACAPRATPYRFRAPLLTGVAAAELPLAAPGMTGGGGANALPSAIAASLREATLKEPARQAAPVALSAAPQPPHKLPEEEPFDDVDPDEDLDEPASDEGFDAPAPDEPLGKPAPAEPPVAPEDVVAEPDVDILANVGQRTDDDSYAFALRILAGFGLRLDPDLAPAADGPTFVLAAQEKGLVEEDIKPLLGDLVLFEQGQTLGVVTSVRDDGTVEFVTVIGRVIRRGFVNPNRPSDQRDARGRILNTFVRPYDHSDPPEQRYLAGELFTGYIRLDRIAR